MFWACSPLNSNRSCARFTARGWVRSGEPGTRHLEVPTSPPSARSRAIMAAARQLLRLSHRAASQSHTRHPPLPSAPRVRRPPLSSLGPPAARRDMHAGVSEKTHANSSRLPINAGRARLPPWHTWHKRAPTRARHAARTALPRWHPAPACREWLTAPLPARSAPTCGGDTSGSNKLQATSITPGLCASAMACGAGRAGARWSS